MAKKKELMLESLLNLKKQHGNIEIGKVPMTGEEAMKYGYSMAIRDTLVVLKRYGAIDNYSL